MTDDSPKTYTSKHTSFLDQLTSLINTHCIENESNTPDYILAEYLLNCLKNFDETVNRREQWHGRDPNPEHTRYGVEIQIED